MSDKTLFNQDLTLNSLTVNNSTGSNASGYTAVSTTINSTGGIVTPKIETAYVYLSNPNFPIVQFGNGNGEIYTPNNISATGSITSNGLVSKTNLIIGTSGTDVVLTCPSNDFLNITGTAQVNTLSVSNNTTIPPTITSGTSNNYLLSIQRALQIFNGSTIPVLLQPHPTNNSWLIMSGGIQPTGLIDSTGSYGSAGQQITANGTGGWSWA
jgi:hypothetical protein